VPIIVYAMITKILSARLFPADKVSVRIMEGGRFHTASIEEL
jgi:hypothetical protein